jgi:ribonucleotide reductase alpha subunit
MNMSDPATPMTVIKRDGSREPVSFDKVLERIRRAAAGLHTDYTRLAQLVLAEIHDGVRTADLDELAARLAVSYISLHPDWGTLAARIIVSNCQRSAPPSFSVAMEALATIVDSRGNPSQALAPDVIAFIRMHAAALDAMVAPDRDFSLDYFGFKTLEKAYLLRGSPPERRTLETPQYMWLRVAVGIWGSSHDGSTTPAALRLERIRETYDLMSLKAMTHATPTLFNAGTPRPQLSSCFLMGMEDSLDGIFEGLKKCAQISKYAGGIGIHVHNIRAQGSHIAGTNGQADGLVPMLRVFNNTARYVNQSGRRNGSFAIYLEPWHADIQSFLRLKTNTGSEEEKARDLFYALWIPDLFMRRVEAGGDWSLFCPHEAPGLADVHGDAFTALYERYEAEGRARRTVPAQKLWSEILVAQIETGTPYLLYKDTANAKSNQKNLGTIKSSNLCVAPETLITTDAGPLPIKSLVDQTVNVWNGQQWSETVVRQTGSNQPLIRVLVHDEVSPMDVPVSYTENRELICTPYHKFILPDGSRVEAQQLRPGQRLQIWRDAVGAHHASQIVMTEDSGRRDDTYCFNEPVNHAGVFNGIMTGNCTEIMEYSSPEETAVCNLASIALPHFITAAAFNFDALRATVAVAVRNLNRVIDINYYPTPETRRSNFRHRPVGLGVQGLADVFARLGLAWESPEAATLNRAIFEHIYYAALEQSATEAAAVGPYETYATSPAAAGQLQPDLWGLAPADYATATTLDWPALRARIATHGLRNSLLVAPMPTASTSQILGYNECIEPFTTNIYARRTLAGEFTVVNRYLVADLQAAGLWSPELKEQIIAANGSIQGIPEIPADLRARYKTVWEIKQKTLIDMAADRGAFICQSQSLNLFVADPTIAKLSSMHFYAWRRGLKTGIYYLRTKSAVQAIKFTVDPSLTRAATAAATPSDCLLCSS